MQNLLSLLSTHWQKFTLALALVGFGAATANAFTSVKQVPAMLSKHDSTTAVQNEILTKMYMVELTNLCIQVSDREHADWTRCLLPAGTPQAH